VVEDVVVKKFTFAISSPDEFLVRSFLLFFLSAVFTKYGPQFDIDIGRAISDPGPGSYFLGTWEPLNLWCNPVRPNSCGTVFSVMVNVQ